MLKTTPPPKVEVEGQHIFPDDELHQYAIRWKELNAKGKHGEAMVLLEKIVEGSTPMFERLAQHEKFHHTVDLEILVSAAQEKVVKWLLRWEPKLGKLFTWFSLHADTQILLEDGTTRRIADLVHERYAGKVMCWNAAQQIFEARQVTDWSEQPCTRKEWSKITVRRPGGYSKPVYLTHEHRVWTQRGWKQAQHLDASDKLYTDRPALTAAGQVEDRIELVEHISLTKPGEPSWKRMRRFKTYNKTCAGHYGAKAESFNFKYDLTVEGHHNFFAGACKLLVSNSKCSKHAFLSELVKVNQYRKRYHSTNDNLEKFIGTEDHVIDKHDLAREVRASIDDLTCRWGDPQEIGALRYLIECIVDDDNRDRQAAIRGATYAWGISPDMAKFFYRWALTSLRGAFIRRIRVNFTEQDLFLLSESYTDFADFHDDMAFETMCRVIAKHGGKRVKIPTLAHLAKLKEGYQMWREIEATDKDPVSIAVIADRHRKSPKSATQTYEEMCEKLNPRRAGEFYIFKDNDDNT